MRTTMENGRWQMADRQRVAATPRRRQVLAMPSSPVAVAGMPRSGPCAEGVAATLGWPFRTAPSSGPTSNRRVNGVEMRGVGHPPQKSASVGIKSVTDRVKSVTNLIKSGTDLIKLKTDLTQSEADLTKSELELIKSETDLTQSEADLIKSETDLTRSETDLIKSVSDLTKSKTDLTQIETDFTQKSGQKSPF